MPAMTLSATEIRRYSRHLSLPEIGVAGQEKLKAARVLVVGAGGLGSPAALYLAAGGVGTLGVLDFDRVEESNLQRQVLYDTASIGMPKADLARMRLTALNPELAVQAHQTELCAANVQGIFDKYDIIVDGSDRIATRYLVNDACVIYGKSLVSAAIHRFEGQAMTYVPGRGPCYRCLFPEAAEGAAPNCAEAGVLGVLPGVMGSIQATEAIKLVLGLGEPLIGRLLDLRCARHALPGAARPAPPRLRRLRRSAEHHCAAGSAGLLQRAEELRQVRSISAAQLAQRIKTAGLPISLIDVREPAEFAASHLPRAINIPLSTVEQHGQQLPHAGTVIFMCHSGRAQPGGRARLRSRMGVSEAWQLEGGLLAWKAEIDPTLRL